MWIVYASVLLNLLRLIQPISSAGRSRNVDDDAFECNTAPPMQGLNQVDYEIVKFFLDLFENEIIAATESKGLSQKIDGQQKIRARRGVKQHTRQQKSSEQQFEPITELRDTVSDRDLLSAGRNHTGHLAGSTTRLLDEATDDRAQLEQHYRRLEAVAADSESKADSVKKQPKKLENQLKRLQGVGVRGRLMCGAQPLAGTKIKLVDVDPRPDRDDLMAETRTDANGLFHLSGATREESDIEVILKIYHDCLDELKECQRKSTWQVPSRYHNNGTLTAWLDVGTVNMELGFIGEERDCRH